MSRCKLLGMVAAAAFVVGLGAAQAADGKDSTVPGVAPPPSVWDAYFAVDGGYNWNKLSGTGPGSQNLDDWAFGARASGSYAFHNGMGVQADLAYERDYIQHDPAFYFADTDGAAHLYWRDPNRGLFGVIGQFGQSTSPFSFPLSLTYDRYYAGVEGQTYLGKMTLYGQIAYQGTHADVFTSTIDGTGWVATAQARYFLQPNWMVYGRASYSSLDLRISGGGPSYDNTTWALALGTEYRPDNSPLSLFASAEWSPNKTTYSGHEFNIDTTKILVGLKLNLGTQTLIERDRGGASLDPLPPSHVLLPFVS